MSEPQPGAGPRSVMARLAVRGARGGVLTRGPVALLCALLAGSSCGGDAHGALLELRGAEPPPAVAAAPSVSLGIPPDVVIILADDLNWDTFESFPKPNIDALAARGMTFTRHYVAPQCSNTRYSLQFGRYGRRDNVGALIDSYAPPSASNPTPSLDLVSIAENWKFTPKTVYQTMLIGKWHLGTNPLFDGDLAPDLGPLEFSAWTPQLQGYDQYRAGAMTNLEDYEDWLRVDNGVYSQSTQFAAEAQLDVFRQWWTGATRDKIAVFCTNLPHPPYQTPPADLLPPGYPTPVTSAEVHTAMLVALDTIVGRMLEVIDLDETYVFFLTDNGTTPNVAITPCSPIFSQGGQGCVKGTVFEGGIKVPLIVAGPDVPQGSVSESLVSAVDVMATVCDLLEVPLAGGEDSISFREVLRHPDVKTRRYVFSETFGSFRDLFGNPVYRRETAVVGERYKLRTVDDREFLFDLAVDPREFVILDAGPPGIVEDLRLVRDDPLERDLQRY